MDSIQYEKVVKIPVNHIELTGDLVIPSDAIALIIFSHGSGGRRFSARNHYVATMLQQQGFATLLFDLLEEKEYQDLEMHFNIPLLTERLVKVTLWAEQYPATRDLPIGYFGVDTGAAFALRAAAKLNGRIKAIVSRGGRPDMAMGMLPEVEAPTLLLVGELDKEALAIHQNSLRHIPAERKMLIIQGAGHLFEEPGALEKVAVESGKWFHKFLAEPILES